MNAASEAEPHRVGYDTSHSFYAARSELDPELIVRDVVRKAKVAIARNIAVSSTASALAAHRSMWGQQSWPDQDLRGSGPAVDGPAQQYSAWTVVATTSFIRLVAARPYSAAHVESSNPDIIMRRYGSPLIERIRSGRDCLMTFV